MEEIKNIQFSLPNIEKLSKEEVDELYNDLATGNLSDEKKDYSYIEKNIEIEFNLNLIIQKYKELNRNGLIDEETAFHIDKEIGVLHNQLGINYNEVKEKVLELKKDFYNDKRTINL